MHSTKLTQDTTIAQLQSLVETSMHRLYIQHRAEAQCQSWANDCTVWCMPYWQRLNADDQSWEELLEHLVFQTNAPQKYQSLWQELRKNSSHKHRGLAREVFQHWVINAWCSFYLASRSSNYNPILKRNLEDNIVSESTIQYLIPRVRASVTFDPDHRRACLTLVLSQHPKQSRDLAKMTQDEVTQMISTSTRKTNSTQSSAEPTDITPLAHPTPIQPASSRRWKLFCCLSPHVVEEYTLREGARPTYRSLKSTDCGSNLEEDDSNRKMKVSRLSLLSKKSPYRRFNDSNPQSQSLIIHPE